MQPRATPAERTVIRWVFGVAFVVALLVIAWGWLDRRQACVAQCEAEGAQGGRLELNAGGRFNLGTHCVCGPRKGA